MTKPSLSVPVADIEREESVSREWELSKQWLSWALAGTEAVPSADPGHLTAQLFKNGRQILVQGKINVQVELPCARTLDPAVYDLRPQLVLILEKRADSSSSGARDRAPTRRGKKREESAPSEEDTAIDSYTGEHIVLDEFVREQLLLELPMFPLRSDLRSSEAAAIPAPPLPGSTEAEIDPRLLPLRAIAMKLADKPKPGK